MPPSDAAIAPDCRVRARKIAIKPSRNCLRHGRFDDERYFAWRKSQAFAANVRGILIHRVRHVTTILDDGKEHHHHVTYLCGNGCNVDLASIVDTLVADPPRDRLLCEFCESKARRKQLPSGDKLAGRHVHRGVLVARRVCCLGKGK